MKKKQTTEKKGFIYFRYVFGVLMAVLIIAGMFVPCLRYTVGNNRNEPISTVSLLKNSWDTSRQYLFDGASDKMAAQTGFSRLLLATVLVLGMLFALGFAFAVYITICAFCYFKDPNSTDKNRIFFLTLVPNRTVLCLYQALLLPITFFPRIIILLYENILNYQTVLYFSVLEPWIIALIIYAVFCTVVFVSARYERETGYDPLYNEMREKRIRDKKRVMTYAEEQEREEARSIDEILRSEQAERIRKMLSNDESDK